MESLNYDFEIDRFEGLKILRDDMLKGGTKGRFIASLLDPSKHEYVYASPVEGGFQIALAAVAKQIGKKATIFCAKRKEPHFNSLRAKREGARIMQVDFGRMSNVAKKARLYCEETGAQMLQFGANYQPMIDGIATLMKKISARIGEPEEIFCAVGSGVLINGIIQGTVSSKIIGVQVGKKFTQQLPDRASILVYPAAFGEESKFIAPFECCRNYDLKALEFAVKLRKSNNSFFWNVL